MFNLNYYKVSIIASMIFIQYTTYVKASFIEEFKSYQSYKRLPQENLSVVDKDEEDESTVGISDSSKISESKALKDYETYCTTIHKSFSIEAMIVEFAKSLKSSQSISPNTYQLYLNSRYRVPPELVQGVYEALKQRALSKIALG